MVRDNFSGLENGLKGVLVGTLITLETEEGDRVTGYVTDYDPRNVELSSESPNNKDENLNIAPEITDPVMSRLVRERSRAKTYPLSRFTSYKVREESHPSQ